MKRTRRSSAATPAACKAVRSIVRPPTLAASEVSHKASSKASSKASGKTSRDSEMSKVSGKVSLDSKMSTLIGTASPLMTLGDALVVGEFVRRPSERNKSPYVSDVRIADGRIALVHTPSLDMGGKLVPGSRVLLRTATDKAGRPVGADQVGKYGTPKCEFIMSLLRCNEVENESEGGVWIGAHPALGEKLADTLIRQGALTAELGGSPVETVRREVTNVGGTDMRCDFLLTHADGSHTVLEVKAVVDTDYDPASAPGRKGCVFVGRAGPSGHYERAAIFPWGSSRQVGPEGEKVVSARAIKHVRELTALASGERKDADGTQYGAAVLFVVLRSDARCFRPNEGACPSFARYLREAKDGGVRILAHRIGWTDEGTAKHLGPLPIDLDALTES